jgi:hypothetical protein
MAHDPGILQERMLAFEDMIIGAADADPSRTDQRVSGGNSRSWPLHKFQLAWFGTLECIYALQAATYI